jgi:hypothetical protein
VQQAQAQQPQQSIRVTYTPEAPAEAGGASGKRRWGDEGGRGGGRGGRGGGGRGQQQRWRWPGGKNKYVRFVLYKENMDTQASDPAVTSLTCSMFT